MPQYSATFDIAATLDKVFAFFTKPANLTLLAPPELHLQLVEGPEIIELGSRLVWKGRRWGISQTIVQDVSAYEAGALLEVEQKQGPFARWVHAHHFTAAGAGTRVREEIQFEPPGGLLGRLITEQFIRKDLNKLFAFREPKLKELLEER